MSKTPSVLDHYPDYELTIGIEVHVQLTTKQQNILLHVQIIVSQKPQHEYLQYLHRSTGLTAGIK